MTSCKPLEPASGRFLHLVHDEKFIDAARAIFEEVAPAAHDFLIVGPRAPLHHLRTFVPARMELGAALEQDFLCLLPCYAAVFVHYLGEAARRIVAEAPCSTRFIWLGWGADYYHLIQSADELLLPKTRGLVRDLAASAAVPTSRTQGILQHFAGAAAAAAHPLAAVRRIRLRRADRRIAPGGAGESRLLARFSAVAMPIEEDYAAVRARHPDIRVPFQDWNYWTEGFRVDGASGTTTGNKVLLGNSATPANNHLDVLKSLPGILPAGRQVICPLSYGDPRYGDAVAAEGLRCLGSRFIPLRGFMDPGAYAEVVGSCSIVVMNHMRQQALGNIILGLCAGAHVFLHERNPIRKAMRRIGVQVYALEELPEFVRTGEPTVPKATLDDIRARIEAQYGRPSIVRKTRSMLAAFDGDRSRSGGAQASDA